ncbi:hypothetical protein [Acinetobacter radioresistens]|uniref:hypothetical protein n=1 Tax=Acinetobacter radioresistens TaxID=40216 RepID=UPI0022466E3B|nr:hypothetical protein [Acinetobacter radioresistens]MCX0340155.1 hypothetical protein [Acinetobacter radioresistens]
MLNNSSSLTLEGQKLIERLDQLDFVDPFSLCYFNEIKAIEREIQNLKKKVKITRMAQQVLTVHATTSREELDLTLEAIRLRYTENAKQADDLETKIYSNINSYDFKAMNIKIRARVDFLDLYFEITKASSRHDIKKFLTEKTGIKHYIKERLNGYVIRLHDMNSLKLLNERPRWRQTIW